MKLARPDEFPAAVDALGEKLRTAGFTAEADRLRFLVHEFVATTSNELYGEFSAALRKIQRERSDLPADIRSEVHRLIKSIDRICRWR